MHSSSNIITVITPRQMRRAAMWHILER